MSKIQYFLVKKTSHMVLNPILQTWLYQRMTILILIIINKGKTADKFDLTIEHFLDEGDGSLIVHTIPS